MHYNVLVLRERNGRNNKQLTMMTHNEPSDGGKAANVVEMSQLLTREYGLEVGDRIRFVSKPYGEVEKVVEKITYVRKWLLFKRPVKQFKAVTMWRVNIATVSIVMILDNHRLVSDTWLGQFGFEDVEQTDGLEDYMDYLLTGCWRYDD